MAGTNHKLSFYFPAQMIVEIQREAVRQDRSLSWVVQQAWRLARDEVRRLPSMKEVVEQRTRDR